MSTLEQTVTLPSQPRIVLDEDRKGVFEIDGLYPGYGHTLGNSLRRIILSSLPGAAITSVKIAGVGHEFSTIQGIKEDVIMIILNLKKLRFRVFSEEPQTVTLKVKGVKDVTGADIVCPSQVEVLSPEQNIATLTEKNAELQVDMTIERGLGYVPKEAHEKERVEIGRITLDAIFTPIRRVSYEVENMRVGTRTDFNRLCISIETDGTIRPREALEQAIAIMIHQLKAIVGFKEEEPISPEMPAAEIAPQPTPEKIVDPEILKTRIETLGLSLRTEKALSSANIRTVGGLVRKKEEDILDIEGLGTKGVQEIRRVLSGLGASLRSE
ncbi:MAG: hypothetical protein G01um101472_86 [Parcubacteria group bacterium Gr01-1014_72]|nr:MAG: hypothetical protein G01um101472_86 [Parcubacteria group bacterium Gr01-1014_72]